MWWGNQQHMNQQHAHTATPTACQCPFSGLLLKGGKLEGSKMEGSKLKGTNEFSVSVLLLELIQRGNLRLKHHS